MPQANATPSSMSWPQACSPSSETKSKMSLAFTFSMQSVQCLCHASAFGGCSVLFPGQSIQQGWAIGTPAPRNAFHISQCSFVALLAG
jgi:hypothetical protein